MRILPFFLGAVLALSGCTPAPSGIPDAPAPQEQVVSPEERRLQEAQQEFVKRQQEDKAGAPVTGDTAAQDAPAQVQPSRGEYLPYRDGVLGTGKNVVLFFHASWSPECAAAEKTLQAWYDGDASVRYSTYKVDFDRAAELKQRFGVATHHTFVLVDGTGKALKTLSGPGTTELAALLQVQ